MVIRLDASTQPGSTTNSSANPNDDDTPKLMTINEKYAANLVQLCIVIKQLEEHNANFALFLQMLSIPDTSMQPNQPSSDHPTQLATLKANKFNRITTHVIPWLPLPAPYHVNGTIYPCISPWPPPLPTQKTIPHMIKTQTKPLLASHCSIQAFIWKKKISLSALAALALPLPTTFTGTSVGLLCPILGIVR